MLIFKLLYSGGVEGHLGCLLCQTLSETLVTLRILVLGGVAGDAPTLHGSATADMRIREATIPLEDNRYREEKDRSPYDEECD